MEKAANSKCQSIYDRYLLLIENYNHNKSEINQLNAEAKKCRCSEIEERKSDAKQLLDQFIEQMKKFNARQKQMTA